jgi:hypothetical protein
VEEWERIEKTVGLPQIDYRKHLPNVRQEVAVGEFHGLGFRLRATREQDRSGPVGIALDWWLKTKIRSQAGKHLLPGRDLFADILEIEDFDTV